MSLGMANIESSAELDTANQVPATVAGCQQRGSASFVQFITPLQTNSEPQEPSFLEQDYFVLPPFWFHVNLQKSICFMVRVLCVEWCFQAKQFIAGKSRPT